MSYQLVLQFPESQNGFAFDEMVDLEERLIAAANDFEVDGHDWGSGEMNIFIITEAPAAVFEQIKALIPDVEWRAAYRSLDADDYTILYPPGLASFGVI